MRIKKFTADNIKEGKSLVLRELGDDAVILSSRTMINPASGKEYIEIVAAVDDLKTPNPKKSNDEIKKISKDEIDNNLLGEEIFIKEIGEIKNTLALINNNLKYRFSNCLSPTFSKLYRKLIANEIPEELALEIVGKVSNININVEYSPAVQYAKEIIADKIKVVKPINNIDNRTIAFFIGSTGAGKTSTLVKTAVIAKLLTNSSILIVSADTYKIGGAEQLQTMAAIVGIPFRAVYTPDELKNIIDNSPEYKYILIDTIGRNYNDSENIAELYSFYEMASPDVTYLVLNASSSKITVKSIIEKFSKFSITGVILSKIDEAVTLGSLLPIFWEKQLPIAYITKGQKIPDDIEPADNMKIAGLMLSEDF
jgi:flagellar biosynthesis protein FlhF